MLFYLAYNYQLSSLHFFYTIIIIIHSTDLMLSAKRSEFWL